MDNSKPDQTRSGHSSVFVGMLNKIANSCLELDKLTEIVETAASREQITATERSELLGKLGVNDKSVPKVHDEGEAPCNDISERRRRAKQDHFNGTEGRIRPRVMASRPVSNIRETGPLGVRDFHHKMGSIHVEAVIPNTGTIFGSRPRISGPGRRY